MSGKIRFCTILRFYLVLKAVLRAYSRWKNEFQPVFFDVQITFEDEKHNLVLIFSRRKYLLPTTVHS